MNGTRAFGSVRGTISAEASLTGTLTIPYGVFENQDLYEGEYKVTPSDEVQVLPTANKVLKEDIVIEASSSILPEGSEMATEGDVDDVIEEVFGEEFDPGYDSEDVATEEELNDVITDVFG